MKTKMLTAVSVIALMGSMPAVAGTNAEVSVETKTTIEAQKNNNQDKPKVETITEKDVERGWEKTKKTISDATEATGEALEETYYDIKHAFTNDRQETLSDKTVTIRTRTTAKGMIGEDAFNADGEALATIEDVILDSNGKAQMVVLRDGGFFGMGGKLVALDYDKMTRRTDSGDIMLPISEDTLDKVAEFSYDRDADNKNLRMIPTDGISVSEILDGHVQNNHGEDVADIDNVTFVNGKAEYLVISYNEILEMGGDLAVMEFDDLMPVKSDDEVNFKLTAKQSADFKAFQKKMETKG